jgi:hypothetical protein
MNKDGDHPAPELIELWLHFYGSLRGLLATNRVSAFEALVRSEILRRGGGSRVLCSLFEKYGTVCIIVSGCENAKDLRHAVIERPIAIGHKGGSERYQSLTAILRETPLCKRSGSESVCYDSSDDSDTELVMYE